DRVGVQLREVAQGQPTAAADIYVELEVVRLVVGGHLLGGDRPAVHDDLDQARFAERLGRCADRRAQGQLRGKRDLRLHLYSAGLGEIHLVAGRFAVHGELQRARIAVGNVGPALSEPFGPSREVDLVDLAELDVDASLADAAAGDAG